jgi:hypothetical protein
VRQRTDPGAKCAQRLVDSRNWVLKGVEVKYAFVFDQQGLAVSLSIEGTKISRIER